MGVSNTITITVPEGALCGLYPNVPDSTKYFQTIDPKNTIQPAGITTQDGHTSYTYTELAVGLYHYGVSMNGFTAVCQILNYTDKKAADGLLLDVATVMTTARVRVKELFGRDLPGGRSMFTVRFEVKNTAELEVIRKKLLNIKDVTSSRRGQN